MQKNLKHNVFNILKNWEYEFYRRYLSYIFIAVSCLNIIFYFLLSFIGFKDNIYVRLFVPFLSLGAFFLPKKVKFNIWQKIYLEMFYNYSAVILFSYLLIINNVNNYWFSSMTFSGLIYGLLSYQIFGFFAYPVSAILTTFIYHQYIPLDAITLRYITLAHTVGFSTFVLSSLIRSVLQMSYYSNLNIHLEKERKNQIEKNFQKIKSREDIIKRYIRPSLLAEVALGKDPLEYEPRKIITSILFVDMRSYTTLTEKMNFLESFEVLNGYLNTINSSVFKYHGEVDKIIGDAVMATFDSPIKCVKACDDMREKIKFVNLDRKNNGLPLIKFGSGISYGEVLSANFGSEQKLDRTIVGDVVNVGARLEQLTKEYHVDVLAMEEFVEKCEDFDQFRIIDFVTVKGKFKPLKIYEIYSHCDSETIKFKDSTKKDLQEIVQLKIEGNYFVALNIVNALINKAPPHKVWMNNIIDPTLYVLKMKLESIIEKEKNDNEQKLLDDSLAMKEASY